MSQADQILRRLTGAGLVVLLAFVGGGDAQAQETIEIRADGPNVSDSAAGADNVRVELNPGRQQAVADQGRGNEEIRRAPRQDREQNRDGNRERDGNNSGGNGTVDEPVPVVEPDESAARGQQAAAPAPVPVEGEVSASETRPVRLPATGMGSASASSMVLAVLGAGGAAAGAGWMSRRRR